MNFQNRTKVPPVIVEATLGPERKKVNRFFWDTLYMENSDCLEIVPPQGVYCLFLAALSHFTCDHVVGAETAADRRDRSGRGKKLEE